jgi:hypothetical protein
MNNITLRFFTILFFYFCLVMVGAGNASSYQVTFETTDCSGDTGFATVMVEEIYKVQSAGCSGPDGETLKQMLTHNGYGSYDAYTLTDEESNNVSKEIKDYMNSRRNLLDRSNAIIVAPE